MEEIRKIFGEILKEIFKMIVKKSMRVYRIFDSFMGFFSELLIFYHFLCFFWHEPRKILTLW